MVCLATEIGIIIYPNLKINIEMKRLINLAIRWLNAPFVSKRYFDYEIKKRDAELQELREDIYNLIKDYDGTGGVSVRIKYALRTDMDTTLWKGNYPEYDGAKIYFEGLLSALSS